MRVWFQFRYKRPVVPRALAEIAVIGTEDQLSPDLSN